MQLPIDKVVKPGKILTSFETEQINLLDPIEASF